MNDITSKSNFKTDIDIYITYEDQLKINLFARHNAKRDEFNAQLIAKENRLKDLDDAMEDIFFLEDLDESANVPNLKGDVFLYKTVKETEETLKELKEKTQDEIKTLKQTIESLKNDMGTLKTYLYAKFGDRINLDDE